MQQAPVEIIIGATFLIFLITTFVVLFLIFHQRRYNQYMLERKEREAAFNEEILRAQLEMKERTLTSLAQEIHDNIGQMLALAKLNVNMIQPKDDISSQKQETSNQILTKVIDQLRTLTKTLNSEFIRNQSLSEAIALEFKLLKKLEIFDVDFSSGQAKDLLNKETQLIIFRIVQECLHNIVKHAQAQKVVAKLESTKSEFRLKIEDDGVGFEVTKNSNSSKGTGLYNIHHRARLIGAELNIQSEKGRGTCISLSVPTDYIEESVE